MPASAGVPVTTWAHLRPGRFHALAADRTVEVCAAVPSRVGVGHVGGALEHQGGVHLVADDARPVPHDHVAQTLQLAPGEHAPPRVVRLAQQHGARARRKGRVEPVEVEDRRAVR